MLHVRLSSEYISASFFQGTFYTSSEGSFQGKQPGELRNEFFQTFRETLPNKLLFLPKKSHCIIS